MLKTRRPQRRVISGTAAQAGPKYKSTRGKKPKAQSDAECIRNSWRTESVQSSSQSTTQSNSPSSDAEQQPAAETRRRTKSVLLSLSRDEYDKNYVQSEKIGEGGCGTVYSGNRIEDLFPVAIKHIQKHKVQYHPVAINGVLHWIPLEVVLMVMAAGDSVSVGKCAAISLLAWCDLGDEILLIMERPESCLDLVEFLDIFQMTEALALYLMKQLVAAAVQMHMAGIFHRDLKLDNILIEHDDAWPGPRVRIIDFGCGSFVTSGYHVYAGTSCYKPPEFYMQGTYEAGPTTVWHLGSILFEILSSGSDFISKRKHLCEPLLTKAVMELDVSNDCKHLLKSCLSFNPYQRISLEQMQWHPWFTSGLRL